MRTPTILGSYAPGTSAVHRADPRVKLLLVTVFVLVVFLVQSWTALTLAALTVAAVARLARVPRGWLVRSLTPLLPLLALTIILNAFTDGGSGAAGILRLGPVSIGVVGLARGAYLAGRLGTLIAATALLALVTPPRGLADAMAYLARPLDSVGVPVDDLAMMMTIALRFMPTLAEELTQIVRARIARGADFSGPLLKRGRVWATVLVPLFVGLFRHADDLATAMEARGYRSGRHPRLHPLKAGRADALIGAGGGLWLVVLAVLGRTVA